MEFKIWIRIAFIFMVLSKWNCFYLVEVALLARNWIHWTFAQGKCAFAFLLFSISKIVSQKENNQLETLSAPKWTWAWLQMAPNRKGTCKPSTSVRHICVCVSNFYCEIVRCFNDPILFSSSWPPAWQSNAWILHHSLVISHGSFLDN